LQFLRWGLPPGPHWEIFIYKFPKEHFFPNRKFAFAVTSYGFGRAVTFLSSCSVVWSKILRTTRHKIDHFGATAPNSFPTISGTRDVLCSAVISSIVRCAVTSGPTDIRNPSRPSIIALSSQSRRADRALVFDVKTIHNFCSVSILAKKKFPFPERFVELFSRLSPIH